jgi:hypothetical protein
MAERYGEKSGIRGQPAMLDVDGQLMETLPDPDAR